MTSSILFIVPEAEVQRAVLNRYGIAVWSAAFIAVLEKRGWLSVDVRTLSSLSAPEDLNPYDLIILAWHGEGFPSLEQSAWFTDLQHPMLIEGPASDAMLYALGVASAGPTESLPTNPVLGLRDTKLRLELGQRCSATLGLDPDRLILEEKNLEQRQMVFDFIGARQRAAEAPSAAEAAANMLISIVHALQERFCRQGFLYEDLALDLRMALSLTIIKEKLDKGRYGMRARHFIDTVSETALARKRKSDNSEGAQQNIAAICARLEGQDEPELPEEKTAAGLAEEMLSWASADQGAILPEVLSIRPKVTFPGLMLGIAYIACNFRPELAERLFLHLRDRLYDRTIGGFHNFSVTDGELKPGKGISNHPHLVHALALLSGPVEMPHAGEIMRNRFTPDQVRLWDRPPLLHRRLDPKNWDVLVNFAHDTAPAILSKGNALLTTFPLLGWVTHYHTFGPQLESYGDAAALGFMAAEELLFCCLERLACAAKRPVPRIAPWPWGHRYALCVRHDVDRVPDEETFDRLMQFHIDRKLGVSWYWLPWRLDPEKIRRQQAAGHEIGLHAVRSFDKVGECKRVGAALALPQAVVGEAYHGTAADFWLGAPSVEQSIAAGLAYTEFAPNMFQFPYAAYPWLETDGCVSVRRGSVGITQNASADFPTAQQRKFVLIGQRSNVQEWVGRGLAIVMLNHPDNNFERLKSMVDSLPTAGRLDWPASRIAEWWRLTHQHGQIAIAWEDEFLVVRSVENVEDVTFIFPGFGLLAEIDGQKLPSADIDHSSSGETRIRLSLEAGIALRIRITSE